MDKDRAGIRRCRQKAGQIGAVNMTRDVVFEPVDGAINDRIDDAYRAKYRGSPYLKPMIGDRTRSATIRIARDAATDRGARR